jgi:hypothetical protein
MDMDSWITGSLDTVKYGFLLIALRRLDLASLASFPTTHHLLTLSIHVVKMNPSPEKSPGFYRRFYEDQKLENRYFHVRYTQ